MLLQILKKIIYLFFFYFFLSSSIAEIPKQVYFENNIEKRFEIELPEEITISLEKKDLNIYLRSLFNIFKDSSKITVIDERYKTRLKGKIFYDNEKNVSAKISITGKLIDHIGLDERLERKKLKSNFNLISSLKISLKDQHISNITKFRLLLNDTRNYDSEILWSIVHELFGFPTLYRSLIKVNFNGVKYTAIFEESPSKEFLERWSLREGPIIGYNDDFFFETQKVIQSKCENFFLMKDKELQKKITTSISFKDCNEINNYINNKDYEQSSFIIENNSFIKNQIAELISFKAIVSKKNICENIKKKSNCSEVLYNRDFFTNLNNNIAIHGLHRNNLKFVYDTMYNQFIPIYNDGNIDFQKINCDENVNLNQFYLKKLKEIKIEFSKRLRYDLDDRRNCALKNIFHKLQSNFESFKLKSYLQNEFILEQFSYQSDKVSTKKTHPKKSRIYFDAGTQKFCKQENYNEKCQNIENPKKIKEYLTGTVNLKKKKIADSLEIKDGYNILAKEENIDKLFSKKRIFINQNKLFIKKNTFNYLKITDDFKEKKIDIQFQDHNKSKLVIFGSILKDIDISITGSDQFNSKKEIFFKNNKDTIRYDRKLLTGCVTIIDSIIKNVNLNSNYSKCEDNVNIIRSKGTFNKINITNSKFDALDVDSSDLNINYLSIINAGNDCIDFSYSQVFFKKADLKDCLDKAVSIGEKSNLRINDLSVSNANEVIAVKDSSIAKINNISANNFNLCLNAYKKKQEFDGGVIYYNKNNCDNKNKNDIYSKLIKF